MSIEDHQEPNDFHLQMPLGVPDRFEEMKLCLSNVPHKGPQIVVCTAISWPESEMITDCCRCQVLIQQSSQKLTLMQRGSDALPTEFAMCPVESFQNYNAFWRCVATLSDRHCKERSSNQLAAIPF